MDFADVIRTTGAARKFTSTPVTDDELYDILDAARFAPSGGNRQGWRVIIIKDEQTRTGIRDLVQQVWRQYSAQKDAGETPFAASAKPSSIDLAAALDVAAPAKFVDDFDSVPVMLVLVIDLDDVSAMDIDLDRTGIVGGASIYPFTQNILLAARNAGLGAVLTTFLARQESAAKELLDLPESVAVAATIALGHVEKHYTKLTRKPVEEFTTINRFGGEVFNT